MALRFVVVGAGPAGTSGASTAAKLGADVTLVEREVVGGAAHLWDCIPSKTMIAIGEALSAARRAEALGLDLGGEPRVNLTEISDRVRAVEERLHEDKLRLLRSQAVRIIDGTARFADDHTVVIEGDGVDDEELPFDAVLVSTGSRPRLPPWAHVDGERILSTRQSYPPPELPTRLVVVGSGVTGVEFTHMFTALGAEVTLLVSRQQVLPGKDPEVAAALEDDFLRRGVSLLKGARADGAERTPSGVRVHCEDGRVVEGSHCIVCIGSVPNTDGLALDRAGVKTGDAGHIPVNHHCQSNQGHIYAAGDVAGTLPLSSVAHVQGRKVAEHVMGLHTRDHRHLDYDKAASAIFTEPEIADVGLAEAEAFAEGRKVRTTKVPFSSNAKALITGDPRGFVKILSDPITGIVLGGSVVGYRAAELISVVALAVTARLGVGDLVETILVHPALAESLSDAAE